jgi:hypothetical protein
VMVESKAKELSILKHLKVNPDLTIS